ncbi:hypothetical protein FB562_0452 [Homoserinimonas aerilata]|uniref:Uncharacterized protein n=1 Tax=Homoserinimonas aerilata TaxID=1162970 RepID=A0A542YHE1_9MICO|nr:hypothetical protein [Homoserinimonas aerilata]TQL47394.1 hypothetical protein FB562_0452 [Homoserinimonas aerilata]
MTTRKLSHSPRPIASEGDNPNLIVDISLIIPVAAILDGRHIRRLPKEVVAPLMRYSPRIPASDWAAIRVFVLDAVGAASEGTTLDTNRALKIAAHFVQWAVNLQGLPQEPGAVFNRRVIDNYCESLTLEEGSRASYRSVLVALADRVAPADNPEPMQPIRRRTIKDPYTAEEANGFRSWANGQRTVERTRKAKLLLAGAAGAGLWPGELGELFPEDVTASESGVTVAIRGRCPREVAVRAEWEEMFLEAVSGCEPGKPMWGPERTTREPKNLVSDFTSRSDGTAPKASRLRGTWLVQLLDERVHISVVFKASGFKQFNNLHNYLPYLTLPSVQDARSQLRGGERS